MKRTWALFPCLPYSTIPLNNSSNLLGSRAVNPKPTKLSLEELPLIVKISSPQLFFSFDSHLLVGEMWWSWPLCLELWDTSINFYVCILPCIRFKWWQLHTALLFMQQSWVHNDHLHWRHFWALNYWQYLLNLTPNTMSTFGYFPFWTFFTTHHICLL